MRKEIWYVAHPVSGDPVGNAHNVIEWIGWLTEHEPSRVYIAPWVAEVLAFGDRICPSEFYDRVLADDCVVVARLDGILLTGGAVSRGMGIELGEAITGYKKVVDWHEYRHPSDLPPEAAEILAAA